MRNRTLFWHLYPAFFLLSLLAVLTIATQLYLSFKDYNINSIRNRLEVNAQFLEQAINELPEAEYKKAIFDYQQLQQTRVTLVDEKGVVSLDTHEEPSNMEDHSLRPEIIDAGEHGVGFAMRTSSTLSKDFLYVAKKMILNQKPYYLRLSVPFDDVERLILPFRHKLIATCLALMALVALVSWYLTRRITRPLTEMRLKTEKISIGETESLIATQNIKVVELQSLGNAINKMSRDLYKRLKTITRQRNEKEALFSSLSSGVMALNKEGRVISLNNAAKNIFDLVDGDYIGESLQAVVRIPEVEKFITEALRSDKSLETELSLQNKLPERYLLIRTSPLVSEKKLPSGVVISFDDITELKRLENVRRDFVANVSHELKTPLTSIQGYSETLLDIKNIQPEQQRKFLQTIYKHSYGLNQMVDDLLNLAKLENQDKKPLTPKSVLQLLKEIHSAYTEMASKKNITYKVLLPEVDVFVPMKSSLVKQAIGNLVVNAIKYTQTGGEVIVGVEEPTPNVLQFYIKDNGTGISEEHQERIFERFFRVDPARHEETGGSGLGLAIVKHIAKTHNGHVSLASKLGQGSVFRFSIPKT